MKPILDWSAYKDAGMGDAYADIPKSGGDFAKAVAVCINSRQCETQQKGVMCPSYRVTEAPALATGGRVRLLKAALNGELGDNGFRDDELSKAMDLCVACKGCKRECENEVDMATIKTEYLAQRYLRQRPSPRTRLLANLPDLLRHRGALRLLSRLRNRLGVFAWMGEKLLGLSGRCRLPEPAAWSYQARARGNTAYANDAASHGAGERDVVLLLDTFSNHFCPENAEAAHAVLSAANYRVHVVGGAATGGDGALCCGRSQLAHGQVAAARENARRMLAALLPHVEAGREIIGLEPACLLAIRDDYKQLGLGPVAAQVAQHAVLFEEFIAREKQARRFNLEFNALGDSAGVLVHGHCHQKAVGAMKAMRKVLKLIPGLQAEFIESSCCGMAGSFGLEAEHHALAMQMAELSLLPALREKPDAKIVANGFSCRHQIAAGVERRSVHVAVLLQEAMTV